LAYLARAVEQDPENLVAGKKLMATLAISNFVPLKGTPIETKPGSTEKRILKDVSPSGKTLAAMATDGRLSLWNLEDDEPFQVPLELDESEQVVDLAWASDSRLAVVTRTRRSENQDRPPPGRRRGTDPTTLHLWTEKATFESSFPDDPDTELHHVAFVANGTIWAARTPDGLIEFRTILTGDVVRLEAPRGRIEGIEGIADASGRLGAVVIVLQSGPERVVSAWSSALEAASVKESDPLLARVYWKGRRWSGPPMTLAIGQDGKLAAVPEPDGSVKLWNLASYDDDNEEEAAATFAKENDLPTSIAFSPDSELIAIGYFGNSAYLYNIATEERVLGPLTHDGGILGIDFSPLGEKLLIRSLDQTCRLWDVATGEALTEPMLHRSYVVQSYIREEGRTAVSIGYDGETKVWDLSGSGAKGEPLTLQPQHRFSGISPDWTHVLATTSDNEAMIQSATSKKNRGEPFPSGAYISTSRFTSNSNQVVVARLDGKIHVRDLDSAHTNTFELDNPGDVDFRAISGDGSTFATVSPSRAGNRDPVLTVWIRNGNAFERAGGIPDELAVTSVTFNDDGSRMVTASRELLRVWERNESSQFEGRMLDHLSVSLALTMNRDGTRFLTGSAEGTIQHWSFEGQPLSRPLKQSGPVLAVAYSPDESLAAAASAALDDGDTGRLKIWDLASQEAIAPAARFFGDSGRWERALSGMAAYLSFNQDASKILLSYNNSTSIWDLAPQMEKTVPPIVPQLAKAIGGMALRDRSEDGSAMHELIRVPYVDFAALKRDLAASEKASQPPAIQWAQWLIATRSGRSISPTARWNTDEYVAHLLDQDTLASSREALLLDPVNSTAMALIARKLAMPDEPSGPSASLSQAAWYAEMATAFLNAEPRFKQRSMPLMVRSPSPELAMADQPLSGRPPRSRGRMNMKARRAVAQVLSRLDPEDVKGMNREELYGEAAGDCVQELLEKPGDLDSRIELAIFYQRLGQLLQTTNRTSADAHYLVSLVFLTLLFDHDDSRESTKKPQVDVLTALGALAPDGPVGPALTDYLKELDPTKLSQAAEAAHLPSDLTRLLSFYFTDQPEKPSDFSREFWLDRSILQALQENWQVALDAANAALKDSADTDTRFASRVRRQRGRLLRKVGREDEALDEFLMAHAIPKRDPDTPSVAIDLTEFYAAGLRSNRGEKEGRSRRRPSPSFDLSPGIVTVKATGAIADDLIFDVRGMVYPAGTGREPPLRGIRKPSGIPIEAKCQTLNFVHAAMFPPRGPNQTDEAIGEYIVHYEDGSTVPIPIVTGKDVADWLQVPERGNRIGDAIVAWTGRRANGDGPYDPTTANLYLTSWTNPRPDQPILSIDFLATDSPQMPKPFLVAITVKP
jgi:WD40 repeat protein